MRLTFICGHRSRSMKRWLAYKFPVDSVAWCPTCHDLRQITKSRADARIPKARGQ